MPFRIKHGAEWLTDAGDSMTSLEHVRALIESPPEHLPGRPVAFCDFAGPGDGRVARPRRCPHRRNHPRPESQIDWKAALAFQKEIKHRMHLDYLLTGLGRPHIDW
jgi:hypothetical protein